MSDAVLALKGIVKTYNKGQANQITVLDELDLELKAGQLVALEAPSGSGKSTLLHIAGLLDTADAGTVHVGGALADGSDRLRTGLRRASLGFVYQFHHLLPEFSALENVMLPQLAAGVGRTVADEWSRHLLGEVGLSERVSHRPAELSGGEQQRVAFCRAVANRPKVLLADEPTGNLDPGTSDTVFQALLGLVRSQNMAALVATHNPELAARMDRRARLEMGRISWLS
ncbi:ABC transporter ATP-binding protein [Shimia ponticola]|uniref:ABC transporter ATP-binding protein n=1 Tax=Shimia ponticola TaxID=2582893 RepID=UPI0011BFDB87|nr:ABC transporter ATP-binding protein [Shimia ponticola]